MRNNYRVALGYHWHLAEPICLRGPHLASASQLRHSSGQRFKSVRPPQKLSSGIEDQILSCGFFAATERTTIHLRTKHKSLPLFHRQQCWQFCSQLKRVRIKAHQLASVEQTNVAEKQNTAESHLTNVQVMMPSPDATGRDTAFKDVFQVCAAHRHLGCSQQLTLAGVKCDTAGTGEMK